MVFPALVVECSQESWKFGASALETFCPIVPSVGDFVRSAAIKQKWLDLSLLYVKLWIHFTEIHDTI